MKDGAPQSDQSGNRDLHASSFLQRNNAEFIRQLHVQYCDNPHAVDEEWSRLFAALGDDGSSVKQESDGPSWARKDWPVSVDPSVMAAFNWHGEESAEDLATKIRARTPGVPGTALHESQLQQAVLDSIRALMLIRSFRIRGHLAADLDPLGMRDTGGHDELDPSFYGFSESDMDRPIFLDNVLGLETATLREIMGIVRRTYCGTFALQYMHISDPAEAAWLKERIEGFGKEIAFTKRGRKAILNKLVHAEEFEKFLHIKHTGTKRFGLDGGEALIPAMEQIIKRGGALGVRDIVIGMPHRGRLNVLANVMGKPFKAIFNEFQGGNFKPNEVDGSGDVKYHLGASSDREFDDNVVHLSLTANPSHLEAVNPVVLGKVRAKQEQLPRRQQDGGHADSAARRRGLRGARGRCGVLRPLRASRAQDRRNHPHRGQQPDRFHDGAAEFAFLALPDRHRPDGGSADLPRQRRRSGGRCPCRTGRDGVSSEIRQGRGHRHILLPQIRPQRGRRTELHPTDHVLADQSAPDHPVAVH